MSEDNDVVDAEVVDEASEGVPGHELEVATGAGPEAVLTLYGTRDPREITKQVGEIATALKDVIDKQGMTTDVGGRKPHIDIEGWQTAGTLLGVQPVVTRTERIEPRHAFEVKSKKKKWGKVDGKRQVIEETENTWTCEGWSYLAYAEARTLDGRVVGRGEAMCSREESRWMEANEPAVLAMAQTRAMSRALRGALAFVAAMAGYSTTPAEEMDGIREHNGQVKPEAGPPYGIEIQKASIVPTKNALAYLLDVGKGADVNAAGEVWDAIAAKCGGYFPLAAGHGVFECAAYLARIAKANQPTTETEPTTEGEDAHE